VTVDGGEGEDANHLDWRHGGCHAHGSYFFYKSNLSNKEFLKYSSRTYNVRKMYNELFNKLRVKIETLFVVASGWYGLVL
jgi:hypothetical protein